MCTNSSRPSRLQIPFVDQPGDKNNTMNLDDFYRDNRQAVVKKAEQFIGEIKAAQFIGEIKYDSARIEIRDALSNAVDDAWEEIRMKKQKQDVSLQLLAEDLKDKWTNESVKFFFLRLLKNEVIRAVETKIRNKKYKPVKDDVESAVLDKWNYVFGKFTDNTYSWNEDSFIGLWITSAYRFYLPKRTLKDANSRRLSHDPTSAVDTPEKNTETKENEALIQKLRDEDPLFHPKWNIVERFGKSFGISDVMLYQVVDESFNILTDELTSETEHSATVAKSKEILSKKLEVLRASHLDGKALAASIKLSKGSVSTYRRPIISRLNYLVFKKLANYQTAVVEIPYREDDGSQDTFPGTRPGLEVRNVSIEARYGPTGQTTALKASGKLSLLCYSGKMKFQFVESTASIKGSFFDCVNSTLLAEIRHPAFPSDQPNGIKLSWSNSKESGGNSLGTYFNDGRENDFWLVYQPRVGRTRWMKQLSSGETVCFGQHSVEIPRKATSTELRTAPKIVPFVKTLLISSKDVQVPDDVQAIRILDNLGATIATTESASSRQCEELPMRRAWGWPIHIHAKPNTSLVGTTVTLEYIGDAATTDRFRRLESAFNLSITLSLSEAKLRSTRTMGSGGQP